MKERAASAVHREKVRPRLQYNYKQLRLNFSTVIINELSRYLWIWNFRGVWGRPSRKIMEILGSGGSTMKSSWNGKSWGVGGQTGKKPSVGGMDISWNHTFGC